MSRETVAFALTSFIMLAFAFGCGRDDPSEGCTSHDDCDQSDAEYCHIDSGTCVICIEDSHCSSDEECREHSCVSSSEENGDNGDDIEIACKSDSDCNEDIEPFCHIDSGQCVECLHDEDCRLFPDAICEAFECSSALEFDYSGFVSISDNGLAEDTQYGPALKYEAISAEVGIEPFDVLNLDWWFDWGAIYTGEGIYHVDPDALPNDCAVCVMIRTFDEDIELTRLFHALEGEIEITEIGRDGEPFSGVLRNTLLVEWDLHNNEPMPNPKTWVVHEYSFSVLLEGDPPARRCTSNEHCRDPNLPYCNTDSNRCVECLSDSSCDETAGEECISSTCLLPDSCYRTGFSSLIETALASEGEYLVYFADSGSAPPLDELDVMWFFQNQEWNGIGTYPIDQNSTYLNCDLCVSIGMLDENSELVRLFFATEGEIEVLDIGLDGDPFAGVLRDVVLKEWDLVADQPIEKGLTWCLDEYQWNVVLDGTPPCRHNDDCPQDDRSFCDPDSSQCVECLSDADCDIAELCGDRGCVSRCDNSELVTIESTGVFLGGQEDGAGTLRYLGTTAADLPFTTLEIEWNLDHIDYVGAGVYQIDKEATPADCNLCVTLVEHTSNDESRLFFAIAGSVMVTEIGGDRDTFTGSLVDVILVEWDTETDSLQDDYESWCLFDYQWTTALDGDLEIFSCTVDEECTFPHLNYCDSGVGACVSCIDASHCPDWAQCQNNECAFECNREDFNAETQVLIPPDSFGNAQYFALSSLSLPREELVIDWWSSYGAPFTGPGIYHIEEDTNIADCGLCVWIQTIDDHGELVDLFFAVRGKIEISSMDIASKTFEGSLDGAVFIQWDIDEDLPLDDGILWCLEDFEIDATIRD